MATITFYETLEDNNNATPPEFNTGGSIRFHNTVDSDGQAATANPLIRPVSGVNTGRNWSYNKFIDVEVDDDGSSWTTITSPTIAASNTGANGELNNSSAAAIDVFLYYAFDEIGASSTDDPAQSDFDEVVDGNGAVTHPHAVTTGSWTAWNNGSSVPYGNVTTLNAVGSGTQRFSAESGVATGAEYLGLALLIDDADQTGGALQGFTLTLTYNEV